MHFRATFNMVIHFIEQPEIKGKVAIDMPRLTIHGLRHTSATFAA
jgi:integrase